MEERYKVIENKQTKKWEIYSVYGEFIASFKTELEALHFKIKLDINQRITQFKLGKVIE